MDASFFKFIDEALQIKEENQVELTYISGRLEYHFTKYFGEEDGFLSINSRIKSSRSFKEKILRNNLYLKYESPEDLFYSLPDLIGVRIECRFNKDEEAIFNLIKRAFSETEDGVYFNIPSNKSVFLKLDEDQPKTQKNKFHIYKVDGYYLKGNKKFSFELQIKSMVNVFWGEIDHRILYKNYTYMLTEDFFRDIMYSIKDNLTMIDRQLMILYNQVNAMEAPSKDKQESQVYSIFSKILHDRYVTRVYRDLGFVIDFDFPSDVLVRYLHHQQMARKKLSSSDSLMVLLGKLSNQDASQIDFHSRLKIKKDLDFKTPFTRILGGRVASIVNEDFWWNLFFKILEDLEGREVHIEMVTFFDFLEDQLKKRIQAVLDQGSFTKAQRAEIEAEVLEAMADHLAQDLDLDYVLSYVFKISRTSHDQVLPRLKNYRDYQARKEDLIEGLTRGPDKEEAWRESF